MFKDASFVSLLNQLCYDAERDFGGSVVSHGDSNRTREGVLFLQRDAMGSEFTLENTCFLVAADHANVGRISRREDLNQHRKVSRVTLADQHEEGVRWKALDKTAGVVRSELV